MRLIDADELIKALGITDMSCERCAWYSGIEWNPCERGSDFDQACFQIEYAPEAVVRCKDCKHMVEHRWYGDLGESAYTCEGNMDGWVLPDSFCSYGERRTDE